MFCGGMNMTDHWLWEAKELNPQKPFNKPPPPQPWREHLAPKNLYFWELMYLPSKRPILHSGRGLDLLGTKVSQWCYSGDSVVGGPNHMEPQPHPLATVAWNNLNLSNCCLQIDDEEKVIKEITNKIKKLAHVPVQT
jgi:hypothetical protein